MIDEREKERRLDADRVQRYVFHSFVVFPTVQEAFPSAYVLKKMRKEKNKLPSGFASDLCAFSCSSQKSTEIRCVMA